MEVTDTMKLLPVSRVSFHIHESVIHPPKDCSPHFLKFLSLVVLYNSISVGILGGREAGGRGGGGELKAIKSVKC